MWNGNRLVLSRLVPEELLTLQLVQLALDVINGILQLRLDNILQCIHTPVGDLKRCIQGDERCLKVCQLHQQLHCLQVRFAAALYLLATTAQACT